MSFSGLSRDMSSYGPLASLLSPLVGGPQFLFTGKVRHAQGNSENGRVFKAGDSCETRWKDEASFHFLGKSSSLQIAMITPMCNLLAVLFLNN